MAKCEVCGNDYHLAFEVIILGRAHVFDSFECAIQKLAPACAHCGCKIIGHGIEAKGTFYCCASCAHHDGAYEVIDHGWSSEKEAGKTPLRKKPPQFG